jgi:hypothetical protein
VARSRCFAPLQSTLGKGTPADILDIFAARIIWFERAVAAAFRPDLTIVPRNLSTT